MNANVREKNAKAMRKWANCLTYLFFSFSFFTQGKLQRLKSTQMKVYISLHLLEELMSYIIAVIQKGM